MHSPEIDVDVWEALLWGLSGLQSSSEHICRWIRHKWTSVIEWFMPNIGTLESEAVRAKIPQSNQVSVERDPRHSCKYWSPAAARSWHDLKCRDCAPELLLDGLGVISECSNRLK